LHFVFLAPETKDVDLDLNRLPLGGMQPCRQPRRLPPPRSPSFPAWMMLFLQPAALELGTGAGNRGCAEGSGFILKTASLVGLRHRTKPRQETERGASEREASQSQGDISPSGKKHPGVAVGTLPCPGVCIPMRGAAGGCGHGVGTFSSCWSLAREGHAVVVVVARAGPGRPVPGVWDGSQGVQLGSPHTAPLSLASPPRPARVQWGRGSRAPRFPPRTPREGRHLPPL